MQNVTIDDTSLAITYQGFRVITSSTPGDTSGSTVSIEPTNADYNSTLSVTGTAGASASVIFQGASIQVTGLTAPSLGTYTATLDGSPYATYSANSNITAHSVVLFSVGDLDTSVQHNLTLTADADPDPDTGGSPSTEGTSGTSADGQTVGLAIDNFMASGPQGSTGFIVPGTGATVTGGLSPSTGTAPVGTGTSPAGTGTAPGGTSATVGSGGTAVPSSSQAIGNPAAGSGAPSAGVVIGAVLGSLAGIGILYYLFRRMGPYAPNKEEKKLSPWDEANLLQNMKNEEVHVTTAANQRYVYPGLIAHSQLK